MFWLKLLEKHVCAMIIKLRCEWLLVLFRFTKAFTTLSPWHTSICCKYLCDYLTKRTVAYFICIPVLTIKKTSKESPTMFESCKNASFIFSQCITRHLHDRFINENRKNRKQIIHGCIEDDDLVGSVNGKASEWTEYTKSVYKQLCLNTIRSTPFTVISIVD